MNRYSYRLHNHVMERKENSCPAFYSQGELEGMTTYQLRNICHKEKLVEGLTGSPSREELIRIILRFRNAEKSLLIEHDEPAGMERLQTVLDQYMTAPYADSSHIRVPARVTLFQGLGLTKLDGYRVDIVPGLVQSNVLLVNGNRELCGILNLVREEGEDGGYYLVADERLTLRKTVNQKYRLLFFRKQESEYLYHTYYGERSLIPVHLHGYSVPVADLEIREILPTEQVLAIDFGTSNTTAGVYWDGGVNPNAGHLDVARGQIRQHAINYVLFPDATSEGTEWIEAIPTIVSVVDCSNPADIRYAFGYEVLEQMRKSGYQLRATVFRGIKRWVNDITRIEEVMDLHGNTASVPRSDILRAFLKHVIAMADHQFKCRFMQIHMTSPVKLKTQFNAMFQTVLSDYAVDSQNALDEGTAVLYNTIAEQIDRGGFIDGEEYYALVIDCGGGTTDLSSCRFRIHEGRIAYRLDIETAYENGDTNFGGNNITYRILQFMKIIFADYYARGRTRLDIDHLIDIPGSDLFRYIDQYGLKSVYQTFEERYREAEQLIPTCYKLYESHSHDDYQRVKGNFHFLWGIADRMKQEFFRRTGVLRNRFQTDDTGLQDSDLRITTVERWMLSLLEDGRFRDEYRIPDVVFNIKEIDKLIKGDIYDIVRQFLESFYMEGRLNQYSIIKLTGQSCRIDVFREALKEFVPGRSIEFRQRTEDAGKVPDLKMACLRGAIRYLNAKKVGRIEADIRHSVPAIPYAVSAFTHTNQEKVLINSLDRERARGTVSRPHSVTDVELFLRTTSEAENRLRYVYQNRPETYEAVWYEDIAAAYGGHIIQDDTDSIVNGETKFFVFADENQWGFNVVPVARRSERLYLGPKQFFAFEKDLSELDFWDGLK